VKFKVLTGVTIKITVPWHIQGQQNITSLKKAIFITNKRYA
jgi:hypothetical protein